MSSSCKQTLSASLRENSRSESEAMSECGSVRWASTIRWYCNAVVAAAVSTAAVVMVVGKSKAGRDPDTNARRRGMVLMIQNLGFFSLVSVENRGCSWIGKCASVAKLGHLQFGALGNVAQFFCCQIDNRGGSVANDARWIELNFRFVLKCYFCQTGAAMKRSVCN